MNNDLTSPPLGIATSGENCEGYTHDSQCVCTDIVEVFLTHMKWFHM